MSRAAAKPSVLSRFACWLTGHLRGESKALGWSGFVEQTCSRCGYTERQDWNGSCPFRHAGWRWP